MHYIFYYNKKNSLSWTKEINSIQDFMYMETDFTFPQWSHAD